MDRLETLRAAEKIGEGRRDQIWNRMAAEKWLPGRSAVREQQMARTTVREPVILACWLASRHRLPSPPRPAAVGALQVLCPATVRQLRSPPVFDLRYTRATSEEFGVPGLADRVRGAECCSDAGSEKGKCCAQ